MPLMPTVFASLARLSLLPLLLAQAIAAAAPLVPPAPAVADAPASAPRLPLERPADHRLVWADEFDTDGLPDPAKWDYDTGRNREGWHNRELQYYAAARLQNSEQRGGQLLIRALRERLSGRPDWGGQAYSSARLVTRGRAAWTYGFFEIRAKLPCARGSWPAIWMLGAQGEWPAAGELDILEHIGHQPGRVFSTVHTASGHGGQGQGAARPLPTACTAFHNYQMLWTPDLVRFGVDGEEHARYARRGPGRDPAQWPFDQPQFLILNIAIGGDLGGAVHDEELPAQMAVDYVRVYQRQP